MVNLIVVCVMVAWRVYVLFFWALGGYLLEINYFFVNLFFSFCLSVKDPPGYPVGRKRSGNYSSLKGTCSHSIATLVSSGARYRIQYVQCVHFV